MTECTFWAWETWRRLVQLKSCGASCSAMPPIHRGHKNEKRCSLSSRNQTGYWTQFLSLPKQPSFQSKDFGISLRNILFLLPATLVSSVPLRRRLFCGWCTMRSCKDTVQQCCTVLQSFALFLKNVLHCRCTIDVLHYRHRAVQGHSAKFCPFVEKCFAL